MINLWIEIGSFLFAASTPTSIPIPCIDSLKNFAAANQQTANLANCANSFGRCDVVQSNLLDAVIQAVVLNISSFYSGLTASNPSNRCWEAGTCNFFCQEVVPKDTWLPATIPSALPSATAKVIHAEQVFVVPTPAPSRCVNTRNGPVCQPGPSVGPNIIQDVSGNLPVDAQAGIGMFAFPIFPITPHGKDLLRSGFIAQSIFPRASALSSSISSVFSSFWPAVNLQLAVTPDACLPNQPTQQQIAKVRNIFIDNMTWNDGSFPPAPSSAPKANCNLRLDLDYSTAKMMHSLEQGIFVQSLWMSLNDIRSEILQGSVHILNPNQCGALAGPYLAQIQESLNIISITNGINGCANNISSFEQLSVACAQSETNNAAACFKVALLKTLQTLNASSVLTCEVYARAQKKFQSITLLASDSSNQAVYNQFLQLKNWAVIGCMTSLFENINNRASAFIDPQCPNPQDPTTCPSCVKIPWSMSNGQVQTKDFCLNDSINANDFLRNQQVGVQQVAQVIGTCFPFAYSALLYKFLKEQGFYMTDLQKSYQSQYLMPILASDGSQIYQKANASSGLIPPIQINQCALQISSNH